MDRKNKNSKVLTNRSTRLEKALLIPQQFGRRAGYLKRYAYFLKDEG